MTCFVIAVMVFAPLSVLAEETDGAERAEQEDAEQAEQDGAEEAEQEGTEEAENTEDTEDTDDPEQNQDSEEEDEELDDRLRLGVSNFSSGKRIWFYDMAGGEFDSDFIIVESQGRWGLIDTGNRYENQIEDSDGTIYSVARGSALSNQNPGKNGRDAAVWMIETLGIPHLDFIIGTHSHSDHIGGVPEISDLTYVNAEGEVCSLVDGDTVYIHKAYHHVSPLNDDLGSERRSSSWHNQAFCYQAINKMAEHGAATIEVSQNLMTGSSGQPTLDYAEKLNAINACSAISSAYYNQGSTDDWFDDYIYFTFGDFSIALYNLFSVSGALDENVNSIVAVVTDGNHHVYLGADINVEQEAEQKVARSIAVDYGTMDAIKVSHHGLNQSTSKELLDLFSPRDALITSYRTATGGDISGQYLNISAIHYGRTELGTNFYMVGASDKALVYDFSDGRIYQVLGEKAECALASADSCINRQTFSGGWTEWVQSVYGNEAKYEYYYFSDGEAKGGWISRWGRWYYFDPDGGLMQRGWLTLDDKTYYLSPKKTDKYRDGEMVTGTVEIDGNTYTFMENGALITGWRKVEDVWYYYGEDGLPVTGWQEIKDKWYFFDDDGVMQTGWLREVQEVKNETNGEDNETKAQVDTYYLHEIDGYSVVGWREIEDDWYYFKSNRKMATGWLRDKGKLYYLNPTNGKMVTGWHLIDEKWYFFDESGSRKTGWVSYGGRKYYLDGKGTMVHGWKKIAGKWYYFGWPDEPESGAMRTGWIKIDDRWYYMGTDGVMRHGRQEIDGKTYYFGWNQDLNSGAMRRGWVLEGDDWFYYGWEDNPNTGAMRFGWIEAGKVWYYMHPSGVMASEEYVNGYWLNKSGSWTYPHRGIWHGSDKRWWFGDDSGWYAAGATYKIDGEEYIFDEKGWLE